MQGGLAVLSCYVDVGSSLNQQARQFRIAPDADDVQRSIAQCALGMDIDFSQKHEVGHALTQFRQQ